MVTMYVDGAKVGTVDVHPDVLKQLLESRRVVEFRTDDGEMIGEFNPKTKTVCEWERGLTREEIDRRVKESRRSSLDNILKRLGAE